MFSHRLHAGLLVCLLLAGQACDGSSSSDVSGGTAAESAPADQLAPLDLDGTTTVPLPPPERSDAPVTSTITAPMSHTSAAPVAIAPSVEGKPSTATPSAASTTATPSAPAAAAADTGAAPTPSSTAGNISSPTAPAGAPPANGSTAGTVPPAPVAPTPSPVPTSPPPPSATAVPKSPAALSAAWIARLASAAPTQPIKPIAPHVATPRIATSAAVAQVKLPPAPPVDPRSDKPVPPPPVIGSAATTNTTYYYVDAQSGADTNPGTAAQPFRTIQRALNVAGPGVTIRINPGRYREALRVKKGGTAAAPLVLESSDPFGHAAVVDGADPLAADQTGDGLSDWESCGDGVYRLPLDRQRVKITWPYRYNIPGEEYCYRYDPDYLAKPQYHCPRTLIWQEAADATACTRFRYQPWDAAIDAQYALPDGAYVMTHRYTSVANWQVADPAAAQIRGEQATQALANRLCPGVPLQAGQEDYLYVNPAGTAAPTNLSITNDDRSILLIDERPWTNEPKHHLPKDYQSIDYVTVRNLMFERAPSIEIQGAIDVTGAHWRFEQIVVQENALKGLQLYAAKLADDPPVGQTFTARDIVVQNSRFLNNGQEGIGGGWHQDVVIEDSEIAWNNWQDFSTGYGAGGIKFGFPIRTIIRNNHIHDNRGPGIWFDMGATGTRIENNRLVHNFANGIQHEGSSPLDMTTDRNTACYINPDFPPADENLVTGNTIVGSHFMPAYLESDPNVCHQCTADGKAAGGCCWRSSLAGGYHPDKQWGAGVFLRETTGVAVDNNLLVGNQHGVSIQNGATPCLRLHRNRITQNVILGSYQFGVSLSQSGWFGNGVAGYSYFDDPAAQNTADLNLYSRAVDYDFLRHRLFTTMPWAAQDFYFVTGWPKDAIYNIQVGRPDDVTKQLGHYWESPEQMAQAGWSGAHKFFDPNGRYADTAYQLVSAEQIAAGWQWPTAALAAQSTPRERLLVLRLAAPDGRSMRVHVESTATGNAADAVGDASPWNTTGPLWSIVPIATDDTVNVLPYQPEHWIALRIPAGRTVQSVRVTAE